MLRQRTLRLHEQRFPRIMEFAFAASSPSGNFLLRSRGSNSLYANRCLINSHAVKKPRSPARHVLCRAEQEPAGQSEPSGAPVKRQGILSFFRSRLPFMKLGESSAPRENGVDRAARGLWRVGWLTWWIQLVLTTVSAVILVFAFAFPGISVTSSASALGLVLTGLAVVAAIISLFWTYSYTRFSVHLSSGDLESSRKAFARLGTFLRLGSGICFLGVLLALLGLQATVGTLLARLFSASAAPRVATQAGSAALFSPSPVQAVDILVVQATANALSSLFAALLCSSWLQGRLPKWQLAVQAVDKEAL